nr:hypothetical protein [uncultured Carboxylicivirga sp.]
MSTIFNNKKQVGSRSIWLTLLVLIALGLVAGYYLLVDNRDTNWEFGLWAFLVVTLLFFYFGGFYYVEANLTAEKIDIKYYNLFPFGRQYKRILVPTDKVKKIKVKNGLGNLGRKLVIEGVIQGRYALFPSVGLSACNKEQIQELRKFIKRLN